MILLELREYIKARRQVSLEDMVQHFNRPSDTLKIMLEHWLCKGVVSKVVVPQSAGCAARCTQSCTAAELWVYYPMSADPNAQIS